MNATQFLNERIKELSKTNTDVHVVSSYCDKDSLIFTIQYKKGK